jgi:hypothetical protein
MPDLLLMHPERRPWFVEVKSEGGSVKPVQQYRHAQLRKDGFRVVVISPGLWPPRLEVQPPS